jgi:hypothetical protein
MLVVKLSFSCFWFVLNLFLVVFQILVTFLNLGLKTTKKRLGILCTSRVPARLSTSYLRYILGKC